MTTAEAQEAAPWAAVVIEADGGAWAFESAQDFETWQNQI